MYKKFLFLIALPLVLVSCLKSSSNNTCGFTLSTLVAPAAEITAVQTYLSNNSLTANQHPSGLFYTITQPGNGAVPTACSTVTVKYEGKLTNGNTFDNSNTNSPNGIPFTLGQLIPGWQIGIPLIQKGGKIKLYIPPSLGYGSSASAQIPANSILIFDIELVNVQ